MKRILGLLLAGAVASFPANDVQAQAPDSDWLRWLGPQEWKRDTAGPIVSLGEAGAFDDQHIFAPCVARIDGRYFLWYCGSRGTVYWLTPDTAQ